MTSSAEPLPVRRVAWAKVAERDVRTFSAVTVAAVGLSLMIAGVGGRLAMALLAATNPENDGRLSDDGFIIGRFSPGGTLQLLGFSLQLGLIAATCYLVARHLVIGPRWFQVVSMAVGAGIAVGALIVHPTGIDFTAFDPPALPIVLFVAIPVVYVGALVLVAERLVEAAWFRTTDLRTVATLALVLWALGVVTLIVLVVVTGVWALWQLVRDGAIGVVVRSAVTLWLARAALAVLWVVSVVALADDISVLV